METFQSKWSPLSFLQDLTCLRNWSISGNHIHSPVIFILPSTGKFVKPSAQWCSVPVNSPCWPAPMGTCLTCTVWLHSHFIPCVPISASLWLLTAVSTVKGKKNLKKKSKGNLCICLLVLLIKLFWGEVHYNLWFMRLCNCN